MQQRWQCQARPLLQGRKRCTNSCGCLAHNMAMNVCHAGVTALPVQLRITIL
jgi:hypothetical protein